MTDRRALGGWLQGPGSVPEGGDAAPTDAELPGHRLGLPATGVGSVAGFGRRLLALVVDWILALIVAETVLRPLQWGAMAPLAALLVLHAALVGVSGRTLGHRVTGLRVARVELIGRSGRPDLPIGPARGLVRAALLCLAVPPLITDHDNRGLHDRLAGTIVIRTG